MDYIGAWSSKPPKRYTHYKYKGVHGAGRNPGRLKWLVELNFWRLLTFAARVRGSGGGPRTPGASRPSRLLIVGLRDSGLGFRAFFLTLSGQGI